jgi:hypothetical protein
MCPDLEDYLITGHAWSEMQRRGIHEDEVATVLFAPEQRGVDRPGRCVYQAR